MVSTVLHAVQHFDVFIYQSLNEFAGNRFLDYFSNFEESADLFKGGIFMAMYWYFWLNPAAEQGKRRKAIVTILIGALIALIVSRMIADLAPFRVRPMYDPHLRHQAYALDIKANLENWSSFPSDTATFFFALALGIAYLSRRLAIPTLLYTAVWICLPRMYLGIHYASDMVVGAAIGLGAVYWSLNSRWIHGRLTTWIVRVADAKPGVFYSMAFLVSFELGVLFNDLRFASRTIFHIAQVVMVQPFFHFGVAIVAGVCFSIVLLSLCWQHNTKFPRLRIGD